MSGDSVPLALPLSGLGTQRVEASALYEELRKPLLRYLACLGMSADEAEDVVQDAFVSLQRHLSASGPEQNIRSWLFRVVHNNARNRQKRYDRRFGVPLESEAEKILDQASPEQMVLEKEQFRRFASAVRSLTETERECLLLRGGGLRYREIGEILKIPVSTVSDTVERAIAKLAEKCRV
jgi:RNA polymerase sigma-70 factor (ECF subfamily)